MIHPIFERYAELLVGYCTEVQPGQQVMLAVDTAALPLARALYREVLTAGGEPHLRLSYPEQTSDYLELVSDGVIDSPATFQLSEMQVMDAYIRVSATENSRFLTGADGAQLTRIERRMHGVQRERIDNTRWVGTLYPTAASAQEAGMSTEAFERFVFAAMFLYDEDPAERWRELGRQQQRWVDRLERADTIHITGPDTDLKLRVAGRTWANSDGKRNMPSGEVFTGPIEDSAEGVIRFRVPSFVRGGLVEDVTLRFDRGRVVEARAARGQEILDAMLAADRGARYLGEIGIGTNPHITVPTMKTLFDEKILGTVHLALGSSYPATGGTNDSSIHWDLICDLREAGEVSLDGEAFLAGGRLLP